jgi:hypothetical protein
MQELDKRDCRVMHVCRCGWFLFKSAANDSNTLVFAYLPSLSCLRRIFLIGIQQIAFDMTGDHLLV